jgi:hypothetical protein
MAEETQADYLKSLGKWGIYALAIAAALLVNALLNKYVGSGTVPPPPAPVIVVSPETPMVVKAITPKVGDVP